MPINLDMCSQAEQITVMPIPCQVSIMDPTRDSTLPLTTKKERRETIFQSVTVALTVTAQQTPTRATQPATKMVSLVILITALM